METTTTAHADTTHRAAEVSGSKNRLDRPADPWTTTGRGAGRRGAFRRGVAAAGAIAVLAVGGFGTLSPAQAQEAHVKQSNYVVA